MPVNFPDSPQINDTYTFGARTWKWDGTTWNLTAYGVQGNQGFQGPQGHQGIEGIYIDEEPPVDTTILWLDTDETGVAGIQGPQGVQGASLSREARSYYDSANTTTYIGIAPNGSAENAAVWKITRIVITNPSITVTKATNVKWTEKLIVSYS